MRATRGEQEKIGRVNDRRIKERSSLTGTGRWFTIRIREIDEGE
jgi:hypothetical protein